MAASVTLTRPVLFWLASCRRAVLPGVLLCRFGFPERRRAPPSCPKVSWQRLGGLAIPVNGFMTAASSLFQPPDSNKHHYCDACEAFTRYD